jgi:hypothetical protein
MIDQRLINLLCRIHRDGGHYIAEHGLDKAIEDADIKVAKLNAMSDNVEQLNDWEAVAADQAMTIAIMKVQLEGLPGAEQLPWNKRPWQQIECPVCGELARAEPQRKPWVGLTEEDIEYPHPPAKPPVYATSQNTKAVRDGFEMGGYEKEPGYYSEEQLDEFARAIEAKLKEKNA